MWGSDEDRDFVSLESTMRRWSRTAKASYDKVYITLARTDDGRRRWDELLAHYEGLKVRDYVFKVGGPDDVTVELDLGFPISGRRDQLVSEHNLSPSNYWAEPYHAVSAEQLSVVALHHFGTKAVPTYNCDKVQVLGKEAYEKYVARVSETKAEKLNRRGAPPSFAEWFLKCFRQTTEEMRKHFVNRLVRDVSDLKSTPEFRERERVAIQAKCREDVSTVLKKYSCLGDDALRDAIRTFLADDVMSF